MANFGDISYGLTIAAGESVRRNAGNTAFEAYTPSSGSGFGETILQDYSGAAVIGPIGEITFADARTLNEVMIDVTSIPVGSNCTVEFRNPSGTNVLNATLQISTVDSLTNGHKFASVTSFTSASASAGDTFQLYATAVGSTTPVMNLRGIVRFS